MYRLVAGILENTNIKITQDGKKSRSLKNLELLLFRSQIEMVDWVMRSCSFEETEEDTALPAIAVNKLEKIGYHVGVRLAERFNFRNLLHTKTCDDKTTKTADIQGINQGLLTIWRR